MNTGIAKGMLIAAIALFGSSAAVWAQDSDGCSNATIKGNYAFRISGEIFVADTSTTPPTPTTAIMAYRDGVAMTHFDGNGKLTQVDFVMGNGETPAQQTPPLNPQNIDAKTGFSTGEWAPMRFIRTAQEQRRSIFHPLWAWTPGM